MARPPDVLVNIVGRKTRFGKERPDTPAVDSLDTQVPALDGIVYPVGYFPFPGGRQAREPDHKGRDFFLPEFDFLPGPLVQEVQEHLRQDLQGSDGDGQSQLARKNKYENGRCQRGQCPP